MTNATVLLAKGLDKDDKIVEVRGTPFYRTGATGVGDSIQALQEAHLIHVPAYLFGEGRVAAAREAEAKGNVQLALQESVWSTWHDASGETDTFLDKEGILGQKGQLYVASFQNGGLFVHNPNRIQNSVLKQDGHRLTQWNSISLDPNEVNAVLDAVNQKDTVALRQMGVLHGGSKYVFNGFGEFAEASAREDFLQDLPGYVVVRAADEARKNSSGYQSITAQRSNEDLAIVFGGMQRLGVVLDVAQKVGWKQFGSHHDGYLHPNSGRVVIVSTHNYGVDSLNLVYDLGRPVGVAPEALAVRAKIVRPLEVTVKLESAAEEARMVSEDHVRRLLTEHLGYTVERATQHLNVLNSYQPGKR